MSDLQLPYQSNIKRGMKLYMDDHDNNQNDEISQSSENFQQYDQNQNIELFEQMAKNYSKQRRHNFFIIFIVIALAVVFVGIYSSKLFGKGWVYNIVDRDNNMEISIPVQEKPQLSAQYYDEQTGLYTTEGIAKRLLPSVVSIFTFDKEQPFIPSSQGSGIILTDNGYIITNAHVIEDATDKLRVKLNNGDEYQGVIVGSDTRTDLAVIKISASNLEVADFGKSSELSIGEEVVAIGSPAGLYGSVTKGIVSGLDRMIKTDENNIEMNCIQIDAAINPGNSGGALVNMYGQVVGINSSKFISEKYDGIGFAISFDDAKPILEELIADGYVKDRVRIGINFYEISPETAEIYNITSGLQIIIIDSECDIANTQLAVGDTITHINGKQVYLRSDVSEAIEGAKAGDVLTATVVRTADDGSTSTFDIEFKLMDDSDMEFSN